MMTTDGNIPSNEFDRTRPHKVVPKHRKVRFVQRGVLYGPRGEEITDISFAECLGRKDGVCMIIGGVPYTGNGEPAEEGVEDLCTDGVKAPKAPAVDPVDEDEDLEEALAAADAEADAAAEEEVVIKPTRQRRK